MLTVLNSVPKVEPNYNTLYFNAFNNTIKKLCEDQSNKQLLKQVVFYGIKFINTMKNHDTIQRQTVESKLQIINIIERLIEQLTPAELLQIFPVSKTYDGEKYQWKDYFYTMQAINSMGKDEVIGDRLHDLLWDYQNIDLNMFLVEVMGSASDILRLSGQKGITEQFCDDNGIGTYTVHKDAQGREYVQNNTTGKTAKVKRKMPRYIRRVK